MPIVRYQVNDVVVSLPFYKAPGFKLVDRWGPPFAIVKRGNLAVWSSRATLLPIAPCGVGFTIGSSAVTRSPGSSRPACRTVSPRSRYMT